MHSDRIQFTLEKICKIFAISKETVYKKSFQFM